MERLQGKLIESTGFDTFVKDFVEWSGGATANAQLELEGTGMSISVDTKRSAERPLLTARGLSGGGEAVAAWLEAEGHDVVRDESDFVTIETSASDAGAAAADLAQFLSPNGRWRLTEVSVRRQA